eukprot:gene11992-22808_t
MSYFDIDDIMAEEQGVPCQVKTNIIKLGHFDPHSANADLPAGAKLKLPLWLTAQLHSKNFVDIEFPKVYTLPYRQSLTADAAVVNLYDWNPFYFDFGMMFVKLVAESDEEARPVSQSLLDAFGERYRRVMDYSQNAVDEDTSELTKNLDGLERKLFAAGHVADKEFTKWRRRRLVKITTAVSVDAAARKRQRRT